MALPRVGAALAALCGLLATGCPNANTYGTARTTPPGKLSHSLAAEGFGARVEYESTNAAGETRKERADVFLPMPPSYMLRVGATDNIDFGLHLYNMSSLGADGKLNFIRGRIDVAIDPGIQWYRYSVDAGSDKTSVNVLYLHGPLLVDFNVNETLSFVLVPGVEYAYVSTDATGSSDFDVVATTDGVFARLGVGVDIRASKKFAVHPEVTVFRNFGSDVALLYMAGIGFNFGNLPSFDDVK